MSLLFLFNQQGSANSSLSLAASEGADSASGSVGLALSLSGAVTEGADVFASAVSVITPASMALSATEGADTFAGAVGLRVSASLAATEGADVFAANTRLVSSSSLSAVEGADTFASNVSLLVTSQVAAVEGADSFASNVSLLVTAAMNATEGADILASEVSIASTGSDFAMDAVEGADTFDAVAEVENAVEASSGGYVNPLALGPKTHEQRKAERDANPTQSENREGIAAVTPEELREQGQIGRMFIDHALFTNHEQSVTVNNYRPILNVQEVNAVQPTLNIEESVSSLDDDELAACALVILQARANSYRRLRTGSHLPFSRAA